MEHLKGASLMKVLDLPANIRLGWKSFPGTNTITNYKKFVNCGQKRFYNIGPRAKDFSYLLWLLFFEAFSDFWNCFHAFQNLAQFFRAERNQNILSSKKLFGASGRVGFSKLCWFLQCLSTTDSIWMERARACLLRYKNYLLNYEVV